MLNLKEFVMWGFLVAVGLGLVYAKGHSDATDSLTLKYQSEQLTAIKAQEEERETTQRALAEVSNNWQAYLKESQRTAGRTIDDLRRNGIGLSVALSDATVKCVTGDGRPLADGHAELRRDSAEFLIGQAQRADAQVRGLQETVKTLQGGTK